jgi:hypothetical protein
MKFSFKNQVYLFLSFLIGWSYLSSTPVSNWRVVAFLFLILPSKAFGGYVSEEQAVHSFCRRNKETSICLSLTFSPTPFFRL